MVGNSNHAGLAAFRPSPSRRSTQRLVLATLLLAVALAVPGSALAQPPRAPPPPPGPAAPPPPAPAPGTASTDAGAKLAEGNRLRASGQYREALRAFQEAYRLAPKEPALRAVAETFRALGDDAAAYAAYEKLLNQHRIELSEEGYRTAEQALRELEGITGTIAFVSFAPGATVAIDGTSVGTTPVLHPVRVNPGEHVVTVSRTGFETLTQTLLVSTEPVTLSGPLQSKPVTGDLTVTPSLPVPVQLQVDGRPVGNLPWRGQLPVGEHVLQAVGPTHQSEPFRVHVQGGARSLQLPLIPRPAQVQIQSGNAQAQIAIDGRPVAYGQWQGTLAAGQHELRIDHAGYQPYVETFSLQPGARILLDRSTALRAPTPAGSTAPTPPPGSAQAEGPPSADDAVGIYGAVLLQALFGTSSTHQYETDCPVAAVGGSCETAAPKGGGLGLRLGYSLGVVGIEVLGMGSVDVSYAAARLPVSIVDPTLQRFAEESRYVRAGGALGLGLRLTSNPAALRLTAGGTVAIASRRIFAFPDALEGGAELSYTRPAVMLDGGLLLGSTPGAKLYLGLFAWFEFSGDLTLHRDLSSLGTAASLVPAGLATVDVYRGTQVFVGPMLGIGFGH